MDQPHPFTNPPIHATGRLDKYFFKSLPDYFSLNDSYKDVNNRGLLERYLDSFQAVSEQYITDVDNLPDHVFPATADLRFLDYISNYYGNPPDALGQPTLFADILSNITIINQLKGTFRAVQKFFSVLSIQVSMIHTQNSEFRYDSGVQHDDVVMHDTRCLLCSRYVMNITLPSSGFWDPYFATLDDNKKRAIQSILLYLLPLNMVLTDFQIGGTTEDIRIPENLIPIDWQATSGGITIGAGDTTIGAGTIIIGT